MAIEDFDQVTIEASHLRPFSKFIMSIGELPTSYLDSLSYAEQVTWFCDYLQNNVIPAINNNADALEEVQNLMTQLQDYVSDYFENLDVQDEINNKLDQMAEDGSLTAIIGNYVDPIYRQYEEEIDQTMATQNATIQSLKARIDSVTSGSPAGTYATAAALTSADPDHDRIYLVLADNKWYYYDTTTSLWTAGGLYQAAGIADGSVTYAKLATDINYNFEPDYHSFGTLTENKYQPRTSNFQLDDSTNYKVLICDLTNIDKIYVTAKVATSASLDAVTFFNTSNTRVSHPTPAPYDIDHAEYEVPSGASYCVINCHKSYTIDCATRTYRVKENDPTLENIDDNLINRLSNKQFGPLDKGYVCFVTDDGNEALITNTLPIIQFKEVPFTFACWSTSQVISNATYRQQIINAINNYGCAICQHGNTSFRNYTKHELVDFLEDEKTAWSNYNINVNGLCYPNHEHDKDIMAICGSIFNVCATGGPVSGEYTGTKVLYDNETNGARTNMYELYRVSLYSHTLDQLKDSVDYAYANNKLLILFTHDVDVTGDQALKIEDIIDYCKQVGITFTTINDLDKIK